MVKTASTRGNVYLPVIDNLSVIDLDESMSKIQKSLIMMGFAVGFVSEARLPHRIFLSTLPTIVRNVAPAGPTNVISTASPGRASNSSPQGSRTTRRLDECPLVTIRVPEISIIRHRNNLAAASINSALPKAVGLFGLRSNSLR